MNFTTELFAFFEALRETTATIAAQPVFPYLMTVLVKSIHSGVLSELLSEVPCHNRSHRPLQPQAAATSVSATATLPLDDPDVELMLQVQAGSEPAFRELVLRWQGPLISFFYRSTRSYSDAEDLSQLTFYRVYRAAGNYEPRSRFSSYIFQIARRLLLNEIRRKRRKPAEPADPSDFDYLQSAASTRDHDELSEAFENALQELPENQRSALLLYVQQEMTYEQIADVLGSSLAAVKTWIFRARKHLRQSLSDHLS